ncbi:hypothetical protein M409DRAFT_16608 [Zasmidium cellare ATCC 36951]|uniref:Cytochrome P450 monooxygenase n=1 Tax=Zasmidium cellare ATCC 36951 TaxID=1080233 RepID=A0A6A6D4S4_ZASCE|nr:uncharacterized protein M409DRAFT_16608 [Zasmidium cellare ATCC 36951]KAF2172646.1 hypothetical protein M409DRAFT_16608 [Zasmidium cellare ATCC 36951]
MNVSLPTAGAVALAIALLGYACYRAALPRPLPGIPYNKKSAQRLLGDAPDLFKYKAENGDLFSYVAKMAVEMNEPVFQVFMQPMGRPWVVIMDPRETHDILTRRIKEFDRSKFFGQIFSSMLPKFHVHMPTGDEWHAHRRLISDTMAPTFLNQVAGPQMWDSMSSMVELWKEKARLAEGRPFSAFHDCHNTTLDIIWAATFGGGMGPNTTRAKRLAEVDKLELGSNVDKAVDFPEPQDPPAFKSITTLVDSMTIPVNSIIPAPAHWFALNTDRTLINARRKKDQLIRAKLREAQEKFSHVAKDDVESTAGLKCALDLVVSKELKMAQKEGRTADLDSQALQDELFGFLLAGEDTTSTALCWALKYLTSQQDVQTKLRNTLRENFKGAHEARRTPSIEEITSKSVPYLDAVIEEANRIGPIVPASARQTLKDVEVLGYQIPAGTDVFMFINGPGYLMDPLPVEEHKRSKNSQANKDKIPAWRDPALFMPERWLDKNGDFNPNAGPFNTFGAGPRGCFGRKWAHLELRIMLILIIWNFELLPTPKELSSFRSYDGVTHGPERCYVRLKALS